jgi:type VI secretion system FHA domain protein
MTPLVVRVENLQTGEATQVAFLKSPVRIGRSEINDLPLAQPFVSTWHAVVRFDEQEIAYVDLGSTNGSVLGGERLARNVPTTLQPGAEVVIGALRLTFARRATGAHPAPPLQATVFAQRAAQLTPPSTAAVAAPAMAQAPAPAPAPPPPPEDPAAAAAAEQALAAAELDIDLLYASFQGTLQHLRARAEEAVAALDPAARSIATARLVARMPELSVERPAAAPPGAQGEAAQAPAPAPAGHDASRLVGAFAESYLPASVTVRTPEEVQRFLQRLAETLEAFSRSFVEMRKGYDEFGKQMGVRTVHGDGPLQRARDARQVMAYLLDPGPQGRAGELQGAFADLMVHQVALLNGISEGARAMLASLSPGAVAEDAPGGHWPMKAQALWKAYEARFHELFDEESAISEALFGKEFARAYGAIVGRGEPEGGATPRRR